MIGLNKTASSQLILDFACRLEGLLLGHTGQDVHNKIRCSYRGRLGDGIIRRADLNDIGTDHVQALEPLEEPLQLAGGPASGLGGTCCRGDTRIQDCVD